MKTNKFGSYKKLALGIALASGVTGANANVNTTGSMVANDVFLSVWDSTKLTSFTADLGVNLTTFVSLAGANQAYDLGAAFTSWAALGAGDTLTYNIAGVNQVPAAGSTVDGAMLSGELANLQFKTAPNYGNLNAVQGIINQHVTDVNTNGLGAVDSTKQSYFDTQFWGASQGIANVNDSTTVGGTNSVNQLFLQYFATNGTAVATNAKLTNLQTLSGSFSLNLANSTLNWTSTAVTAVPVPAAVWLFLGGLMSVLGFQKRKSALAA